MTNYSITQYEFISLLAGAVRWRRGRLLPTEERRKNFRSVTVISFKRG